MKRRVVQIRAVTTDAEEDIHMVGIPSEILEDMGWTAGAFLLLIVDDGERVYLEKADRE